MEEHALKKSGHSTDNCGPSRMWLGTVLIFGLGLLLGSKGGLGGEANRGVREPADPCACQSEGKRMTAALQGMSKKPEQSRQPDESQLLGFWCWKHNCPVTGVWTGMLDIGGDVKELSGTFFQCTPGKSGYIVKGGVREGHLRFLREVPTFAGKVLQIWNAKFVSMPDGDLILIGEASHAFEICNVFAVRAQEER